MTRRVVTYSWLAKNGKALKLMSSGRHSDFVKPTDEQIARNVFMVYKGAEIVYEGDP